MTIEIKDPRVQRLIEEELREGRYVDAEALIEDAVIGKRMVREAVEQYGGLDSRRWDALIAEGESSGECMSADDFFAWLDEDIALAKAERGRRCSASTTFARKSAATR